MTSSFRWTLAAFGMIGAALASQPLRAATLMGLTADNALVRIDSETRRASPPCASPAPMAA